MIEQRYARAIFNHLKKIKKVKVVHADLMMIDQLFVDSDDFVQFIKDPSISPHHREGILNKIFKKKISSDTYQFLLFLSEKNRLSLLHEVIQCFDQLALSEQNIIRVNVFSKYLLERVQTIQLEKQLKEKLGKTIESHNSIDEDIIGGIRIKVSDTIYDYSMRYHLDKFKTQALHS